MLLNAQACFPRSCTADNFHEDQQTNMETLTSIYLERWELKLFIYFSYSPETVSQLAEVVHSIIVIGFHTGIARVEEGGGGTITQPFPGSRSLIWISDHYIAISRSEWSLTVGTGSWGCIFPDMQLLSHNFTMMLVCLQGGGSQFILYL